MMSRHRHALRFLRAALAIALASSPAASAAPIRTAPAVSVVSFESHAPALGRLPVDYLQLQPLAGLPALAITGHMPLLAASSPATLQAEAWSPAARSVSILPHETLAHSAAQFVQLSEQRGATPAEASAVLFDGYDWLTTGAALTTLAVAAGVRLILPRAPSDARARRAAPSPAADFLISSSGGADAALAARGISEFIGGGLDGEQRRPPSSSVPRPTLLHGNAGAYRHLPLESWPAGLKEMAARLQFAFDQGERGDGFWGLQRRGAAEIKSLLDEAITASSARLAPRETRGVSIPALVPALAGLSIMLQIVLNMSIPAPILLGAGGLFIAWLSSMWSADGLRLVRPRNPDDTPQARHQHALLEAFSTRAREHLENPISGDFTFLSLNATLSLGPAVLNLLMSVDEYGRPALNFMAAQPAKGDFERDEAFARRYGLRAESVHPTLMPNPALPAGTRATRPGPGRYSRLVAAAATFAAFVAANSALYAVFHR